MIATARLRKHSDYQRVYAASRKQFSRQMSYFFALRVADPSAPKHTATTSSRSKNAAGASPALAPRVGLTVGKAMGKALDRNRIKRRMREAVRRNLALLTAPVDVILHPRRAVLDLAFADLSSEVAHVFRAIEKSARQLASTSKPTPKPPHAASLTSAPTP